MRTSNKILLGLLVATILLFTSLFGAVRIKYNSGQMVKDTESSERIMKRDVPLKEAFTRVDIFLMADVTIIPSKELKLKKWDDDSSVKCYVEDGVLHIKSNLIDPDGKGMHIAQGHVELFLPDVDSIRVLSSDVTLRYTKESSGLTPSFNFMLNGPAELKFENGNPDANPVCDTFRVNASEGAAVRFYGMPVVKYASFTLKKAVLEDADANFGQLNIQTDSSSQISIKGNNLRKAVITSKE